MISWLHYIYNDVLMFFDTWLIYFGSNVILAIAIGIFIYTPQSMVMGLIMYAMTKHYYLLCFMFVIKISPL